jgi:hypothetical protein
MMDAASPNTIFSGLLARGYSPVHAAALAGNMQQESAFDPTNVNQKEGAHGLLQWRLDRWNGLQDFAKSRGTDPTDVNTQLDYIGQEIGGPESKAGSKFLAATDLPSANAALKGYIRYGDDSEGTRLKYASGILNGSGSSDVGSAGPPISSGSAPGASTPSGQMGVLNGAAPGASEPQTDPAMMQMLARSAQAMQPQASPVPPLAPINYPMPAGLSRARLLAAANMPIVGT